MTRKEYNKESLAFRLKCSTYGCDGQVIAVEKRKINASGIHSVGFYPYCAKHIPPMTMIDATIPKV